VREREREGEREREIRRVVSCRKECYVQLHDRMMRGQERMKGEIYNLKFYPEQI
jgi:hypothetical protein